MNILDLAIGQTYKNFESPVDMLVHIDLAIGMTIDNIKKILEWKDKHPKLAKTLIKEKKMSSQLKYYYRRKKWKKDVNKKVSAN